MFQLRNPLRRSKENDWQPWILERPKSTKVDWKFLIGSPTAWLALFISIATAFYSLVYHSDELGVIVPTPIVWLEDNIAVAAPRQVTFINSGSRPIALLNVRLTLVQPRQKVERADCARGQMDVDILKADQVVFKPYEIVVSTI